MKRTKRSILLLLTIIMMFFGCFYVKPMTTHAASNKTYYYIGGFHSNDKYSRKYKSGAIQNAYIKGNTIYIKGALQRYTAKNFKAWTNGTDLYAAEKYKYLKFKTRKFKLTKKTKYKTGNGYAGWHNISKSAFNKTELKWYSDLQNGIGFEMKVKNGKVVYMKTSP